MTGIENQPSGNLYLVSLVLLSVLTVTLSIIAFMIKKWMNDTERRFEKLEIKTEKIESKVEGIQRNYLDRFEEVKDLIRDVKSDVNKITAYCKIINH